MSLDRKPMEQRWNDVVKAVVNKEADPHRLQAVLIGGIQQCEEPESPAYRASRAYQPVAYPLGKPFEEISFTRREAECMVYVLRKMTNNEVADRLGLSARTVEFYVRNMRYKLDAMSKVHLIELVAQSEFLKFVDF